jgi:hypothetical protein
VAPTWNNPFRTLHVEASPLKSRHFGITPFADYHWFSDWGRDTMIALPGLTLPTGKHDVAREAFCARSSYAHLPLYLCVAVVGVGVEHVIALPQGAHLHREDAWILTAAAAAPNDNTHRHWIHVR